MNISDILPYYAINENSLYGYANPGGTDETSRLFENFLNDLVEILNAADANNNPTASENTSGMASRDIAENAAENAGNIEDINAGDNINSMIDDISEKYGMDTSLIKAVVKQESGYNVNAESSAGAQGLMQLMPGTAKGLGVNNSFDPVQNINGGVKYLNGLLNEFGYVKKALAADNAGPGYVERNGLDNLPLETKNYINSVLSYKNQIDKMG